MLLNCIIYFLVGIILDLLVTQHYLATAHGQRIKASTLSVAITLVSVFILVKLIDSNSIVPMLFYAGGNGLGCFIAMRKCKKSH
jgi:uncharacterized protein YebE (UPF0316 family)